MPRGKDFLHPGHLSEWAGSLGEEVWVVNDGIGLGTGTFTQLREAEEGRGRGNMFGERLLGGAKDRGREAKKQNMKETEMKY